MDKERRNLLDVLKTELAFLEKGGYSGSVRQPWRCQLLFEDSPTCANYDARDHSEPCSECVLMQVVPPRSRGREDSLPPYSPQRAGGDAGLTLPIRGST
jgi:hypothetical protein